MDIIITPGETALIGQFVKIDRSIKIENLLIGDIHLRKGNQTLYIFERKAKGDLDASIKDGRYKEQKGRLLETGIPRKNIVYIIEQLSASASDSHKRVWSAMCNMQHRDGFTVFQTKNIAETAEYIIAMAGSCEKFTAYDQNASDNNQETQVSINIKKKGVSSEDWFAYSLALIPKCSIAIAKVITAKYTTISELISAIQHEGPSCLSELKHGRLQRRIGNKLSSEICEIVSKNYE